MGKEQCFILLAFPQQPKTPVLSRWAAKLSVSTTPEHPSSTTRTRQKRSPQNRAGDQHPQYTVPREKKTKATTKRDTDGHTFLPLLSLSMVRTHSTAAASFSTKIHLRGQVEAAAQRMQFQPPHDSIHTHLRLHQDPQLRMQQRS